MGTWERDRMESKRAGREEKTLEPLVEGEEVEAACLKPHAELARTLGGTGWKPAEQPLASREETEAGVLDAHTLKQWKLDSGKQMGVNTTRLRWQGTMTLYG